MSMRLLLWAELFCVCVSAIDEEENVGAGLNNATKAGIQKVVKEPEQPFVNPFIINHDYEGDDLGRFKVFLRSASAGLYPESQSKNKEGPGTSSAMAPSDGGDLGSAAKDTNTDSAEVPSLEHTLGNAQYVSESQRCDASKDMAEPSDTDVQVGAVGVGAGLNNATKVGIQKVVKEPEQPFVNPLSINHDYEGDDLGRFKVYSRSASAGLYPESQSKNKEGPGTSSAMAPSDGGDLGSAAKDTNTDSAEVPSLEHTLGNAQYVSESQRCDASKDMAEPSDTDVQVGAVGVAAGEEVGGESSQMEIGELDLFMEEICCLRRI